MVTRMTGPQGKERAEWRREFLRVLIVHKKPLGVRIFIVSEEHLNTKWFYKCSETFVGLQPY